MATNGTCENGGGDTIHLDENLSFHLKKPQGFYEPQAFDNNAQDGRDYNAEELEDSNYEEKMRRMNLNTNRSDRRQPRTFHNSNNHSYNRRPLPSEQTNNDFNPPSSSNQPPSVFGSLPSWRAKRSSDTISNAPNDSHHNISNIYLKYDMKKRKVDTSDLAIYKLRDRIVSSSKYRQVTIVEGFTGCGKTTQVPQFLLDDCAENNMHCNIVVTQPRRIAAISIAKRVCEERNWPLGSLVGYQVGMDKNQNEDTRINYMTTGVLLQTLISRKSLNEFTHVIIDEVHERDLDTDLLLLIIKKILIETNNVQTRIFLMSATLNVEKFASYFPQWFNEYQDCFVPGELGSASEDTQPSITDDESTKLDVEQNGLSFIKKGVHIVKIPLRNLHKIDLTYLEELPDSPCNRGFEMGLSEEPQIFKEAYEAAVKIILNLDANEQAQGKLDGKVKIRGAVLIFLPGLLEIDTLYKMLEETAKERAIDVQFPLKCNWTILPLHSTITNEEQQRVFKEAPTGFRKLILATNIAESSITVTDIKYVIDFCLTKSLSCDPQTNYTCLRLEWASKNQCIQRKGRAGRVSDGQCYRLVTKRFYNELLVQEATPEMLKSCLEAVVLQVKVFNMGSPKSILALALDPPSEEGIIRSVANLKEVGAITITQKEGYSCFDGDLTYMGSVIAKLPIDIHLGRLIMLGYAFGCLEEAIIIASCLSVKSPFSNPYHRRLHAYMSKLSWAGSSYSDCFALLNLYRTYVAKTRAGMMSGKESQHRWARSYYAQLNSLREVNILVDEIKKRLKTKQIHCEEGSSMIFQEQGLILKIVIAGAFYPNYFNRTKMAIREYQKNISRELGGRDPYSTVAFFGFPSEQPGELYANFVGQQFTHSRMAPTVDFYSSKVLITFDLRGNKVGPISYGVYRAIKMRQLRNSLNFTVAKRMDAEELCEQYKAEREANPIVLSVPSPEQTNLPGIADSVFKIRVTQMETPHEFYFVKEEDFPLLLKLNRQLQNMERLESMPTKDQLTGCLCIVKDNGHFYRARIDTICTSHEKDIMIYYIDYGDTTWRKSSELYKFTDDQIKAGLNQTPALAIQGRIANVKPSVRNGSLWHEEAMTLFSDFVTDADDLEMNIYSVVDNVCSGELTRGDRKLGVLLLDKKLADPGEENMRSRENYAMRRDLIAYPDEFPPERVKDLNEKQQCPYVPTRYLPSPPDDKCDQLVQLRGPSSPLEMSFSSLCRSAHFKQVVVDGSSVNSIALDVDQNCCSRVLVASNLGISQKTGHVVARDTTILPPIPGLLGLLTMIFCPKMELRIDATETRYTGCMSGLGVHPVLKEPIYPDHDMEIIFDTVFNNTDIARVNSIRLSLNTLLAEGKANNLALFQKTIRKEIIGLLETPRNEMEEQWSEDMHKWVGYNGRDILPPGKTSPETDIFPLHSAIVLQDPLPNYEEADRRRTYFIA